MKRIFASNRRGIQVFVLAVVLCAGGVLAVSFGNVGSRQAFISSEVRFTDASVHGLAIVPASCPSYPHYAGECDLPPVTIPTATSCLSNQSLYNGSCVYSCPAGTVSVNGVCITSTDCPIGYVLASDGSCAFSACPGGFYQGVDANGNATCYVNACQPAYICSGNDLVYQNTKCRQDVIQSCTFGCTSGACEAAKPPSGTLKVAPTLVRSGNTAVVTWATKYAKSCAVSAGNGDAWGGTSGTQTSKVITGQVIYTLTCAGLDGSNLTQTATVNIVPKWQEN